MAMIRGRWQSRRHLLGCRWLWRREEARGEQKEMRRVFYNCNWLDDMELKNWAVKLQRIERLDGVIYMQKKKKIIPDVMQRRYSVVESAIYWNKNKIFWAKSRMQPAKFSKKFQQPEASDFHVNTRWSGESNTAGKIPTAMKNLVKLPWPRQHGTALGVAK